MRDLGSIYTLEWFERDFAGLQPEFDLAAFGIARWARSRPPRCWPDTVLDVGCGPGMLVRALNALEFDAVGFDGSPHALAYARRIGTHEHVACLSMRAAGEYGPRDLLICTEVAEHLPAEEAPELVAFLTSRADDAIIFTAAPPGQGGHDHVNEQPREYWLDLFAAHAWIEDEASTEELRRRWRGLKRLSHMPRNLMVLR